MEYREKGEVKIASFRELSLRALIDKAITGQLDAIELVLSILSSAEQDGDQAADILIENWIADYPGQTAEQKSKDFENTRDAPSGT